MKITLTPDILDELLAVNEEAETADYILNEGYFALSEEELSIAVKAMGKGETPSSAYRRALLPLLDQEAKEMLASVQVGYGLDEIKALDAGFYQGNPYYQKVCSIVNKKTKIGDWALEMKSYMPYQLFVYDEVLPSCPYASYSPIGFFKGAFPYPALSQKGTTYMSLIPHEINTMAEPIQKAHGRVLTMGLGMGYFAFMASRKDEVASVTVLERDPSVVSLFKKAFLPLFDHPEKVEILLLEDALLFEAKEPYDYLFADLHHDATDGLPLYIRLLRKKDLAKEVDVWIEKAILEYMRRHVIALIGEESDGSSDAEYESVETFSDSLLRALHFHLKNYELSNQEQLAHLLSDETLRSIAETLKI
ncbi:MAG: hypothetical protein IJS52_00300 [Bacilli bacterium]|nr:hypothetical protein [Bacilli bacterium]